MRKFAHFTLAAALCGCAGLDVNQPTTTPHAQQEYGKAAEKTVPLTANQAQRLNTIMTPLIARMDRPIPMNQVHVTVMAEPHINAANGGGGDFYVSEGLLAKANDDRLRAIMAHEIAHADLGHVNKAQTVGTGVSLGAAILGQVWPGAQSIAPVAGQLIMTSYSRSEETAADKHGVEILRRAGYDGKSQLVDALTWLQQTEGNSGGGFFSTHPATGDRIQTLQKLPD